MNKILKDKSMLNELYVTNQDKFYDNGNRWVYRLYDELVWTHGGIIYHDRTNMDMAIEGIRIIWR